MLTIPGVRRQEIASSIPRSLHTDIFNRLPRWHRHQTTTVKMQNTTFLVGQETKGSYPVKNTTLILSFECDHRNEGALGAKFHSIHSNIELGSPQWRHAVMA